uniref:3-hydroxyisobutyryl-CoA hydrolase n=1 Tax=Ciona savignyi TaxID=51511 RepID=H2Y756_CIOSA
MIHPEGFKGFSSNRVESVLHELPGGSVDLKLADETAHILLNNPSKKNAVTGAMMLELRRCVMEISKWEGKAVVLSGAGGTFCAGSDLNAVRKFGDPQEGLHVCMYM